MGEINGTYRSLTPMNEKATFSLPVYLLVLGTPKTLQVGSQEPDPSSALVVSFDNSSMPTSLRIKTWN
jgi:hypothetical protein